MLYEIIQDNKMVWFCGNDHIRLLLCIQYMVDGSDLNTNWTTFFVYKIDGANVTAIPLAAYIESYKIRKRTFEERMNDDR